MSKSPRLPLILLLALGSFACGSDAAGNYDDDIAPLLRIDSPTRGTSSQQTTVTVRGHVSDENSGIKSLHIGDTEVTPDQSGDFRVDIELHNGINFLEIVAEDRAGNQRQDTRAILSGDFAEAQEEISQALQLQLGEDTFNILGQTTAAAVDALDIDALLVANNPVMVRGDSGEGDCLNVSVDMYNLDYQDMQVRLIPQSGGILAHVTLSDVFAEATANYEVACVTSDSPIDIEATEITATAFLDLSVANREVAAEVTQTESTFRDVEIDFGIIPGSIVNLLVSDLDQKIADQVTAVMETELPPIVESYMKYTSFGDSLTLLGTEILASAEPTEIVFDSSGGAISYETHIMAPAGGMAFLSNPNALPSIDERGFALAIADDALNQAMAALWSAGALNRDIPLESSSGAGLGAGIADRIRIRATLPPVISEGEAHSTSLSVGDAILELVKNGQTEPVNTIAVNLQVSLDVQEEDGELFLSAEGDPKVSLSLIGEGYLNEDDMQFIENFAVSKLQGNLQDLLGSLPLPTVAGTTIASPQILSRDGYLQVSAELQR